MRSLLMSMLWFATTSSLLAKEPLSISQITEKVRPSIVTVTQIGRGGEQEALGTGFVISKDGLIVTNLHVIGNARLIKVRLSDGTSHEVKAIHATDPTLDLAIIKIERTGLKPLPLGDSSKVQQGQPVIAIGHPQGLEYSVVEGVVSAIREVEEAQMIQIAIPIEQGNSGGPLLDLQGRVQGILTLKSAITENLGFAHSVNDLKLLIEKPNPVPMSRWLTIGRLDERTWKPVLGGRWTQHAGVIQVEGLGEGFGGRALCLFQRTPPGVPYEVSVQVRLNHEEGAAGLVLCSDGGDQHYGFYPSAGKMRLTRFNGPDVFSWTILHDVASPAYNEGGWNTLRVRVEEDTLRCYVNNQLVVEQQDSELRGGHAGLCKFRSTKADFKTFQIGESLAQQAIPEQLAAELENELSHYLEKPSQRTETMEKLLAEPAAARSLLESRVKVLEEQAASLRKLEKAVHRETVGRELTRALLRPADQTDLMKAALLVAKHDNPELDVESYLQVMQRMADELKDDPVLKQGTSRAAARLADYLFKENGFHGSRSDDMDDFSNSYLNEVLDDREGIPITLSIVYLELARRLGLKDIYGVSLPGRFMVAYDEDFAGQPITVFIDVFSSGKLMQPDEAERFIFQTTGQTIADDQTEAATPRAIILRLLYNLTSFSKRPDQALPYLDLILAIDPEATPERLNRALFRMKSGDLAGAKLDLQKLIESKPPGLDMQRVDELYQSL
jgi:serine protease Do